ncbi:heme A synthase [Cereibacter sphaeroides]|uniref:Heme A synthase n=1 Tax=Cereibacter sphaeroides TaxID=1063 RepID=A0AAX1UG03_CERSP|nr:heme A synthase [Cereibacter sphaeroides]RHZ90966.1 heme A synthase [Cereibacter sphaeroides]
MAVKKRSIFEEVGQGAKAPVPQGGSIDRGHGGARRGIRLWLMALFLLVMAMIVVGGLTRLTESGLSITEWRPVTGAVPPLNETQWAAEFDKYRDSPQYRLMNAGMTLAEFQRIYWWEWGHRQLGRVIGLVWAVGFLGFLAARRIPRGWWPRLLALGALGGLQGGIGWWMVASGLEGDKVTVESTRLATHLGLAFVILGLIAWQALLLGRSESDLLQARRQKDGRLVTLTTVLIGVAFLQIVLGALVAGIDAGRGFPTWPDMNGTFLPADMFYVPGVETDWRNPAWWLGLLQNPGFVQFLHRMAGYTLAALGLIFWIFGRRSRHRATRGAFDLLAMALLAQILLGVGTVLSAVEWQVAIAHQVGAVVIWVLILHARHLALYPRVGSIRKGTL